MPILVSHFYSRSSDCDIGTLESDCNMRGVWLLTQWSVLYGLS